MLGGWLEGDPATVKLPGILLELFQAFGTNAVGSVDMKVFGKVIFEAHPSVLVADFSAPGANF